MRANGLRGLIPALVLAALVGGCGQKGPNHPLELPLPAAPKNASLAQRGEGFVLSWDIPQTNQDGSALTDLQGFRVLKRPFVPGDECPECRDPSVPLAQIDLDYLRGVRRDGERITLSDDEVAAGTGYRYRIVPFTRTGQDGAPTQLDRVCRPAPPAPTGLRAEGLDSLVRLHWEAPAPQNTPGTLVGYRIYRRQADEPFFASPLNREPQSATTFEDFARQNGLPLVYAVSTLSRQDGDLVESVLSETVNVTPKAGY